MQNEKLKIKTRQRIFQQWPILCLIFINFLFFFRLFYPETKIFTTPDFGLSDILHFNYPLRYILAQFLKNGQLPLWVSKVGGGFPLFATGQTGALNIVVFLTALLFPPAVGFSLTYVFAYLLMGIFTYLFARIWKLSKMASFLAALIFSFSGSNITHFAHTDHLLTVSFLPLAFYTLEQAIRRKSLKWWIVLAIAGSQLLLSGNANAAVYGFFALGVYFLWRLLFIWREVREGEGRVERNKEIIKVVTFALFAVVSLLGLSAVQLLPALELTSLSERASSTWSAVAQAVFPYPPKHLLTFLNPYLLGDPHKATYPMYGKDWGLFWENTGYIGLIPLVLAFFALISALTKVGHWMESNIRPLGKTLVSSGVFIGVLERQKQVLFWAFLAFFTLTLSFGKYTPFFFILKLPILNLFRIPSTFLFVTDFALAILAAYGLDALISKIPRRRLHFFSFSIPPSFYPSILLLFSLLDLWSFGYNYNPVGSASDWEQPPQTAQFLKKDQYDYRIFSPLSSYAWDQVFITKGWQDGAEEYLPFRNGLTPDINLLYGITSADFYTGVAPRRVTYLKALLVDTIQVADQAGQKELLFSEGSSRLMKMMNIRYVVTPGVVNHPDFELVFETNHVGEVVYRAYQNRGVFPRIRVVGSFEVEAGIGEVGKRLVDPAFEIEKKVILEKEISQKAGGNVLGSTAEITKDGNFGVEVDVKMKDDGILVLADSFYPGWKVMVDGEEKEILAANINQRAVVVFKGKHKVNFVYGPKSFRVGKLISLLSLLVCIGVVAWDMPKKLKIKAQKLKPQLEGQK